MKRKRQARLVLFHIVCVCISVIMVYPILWMAFSSFKVTETVIREAAFLLPSKWTIQNYINGWKGFAGISFERLDNGESLQWPCKDKQSTGTPIMHVGHPARGKALFYPALYKAASELPDDDYPFFLTTGRILYQYNAAAMTSRSEGLVEIAGEGFIEINYKDAERLGIKNGERIYVESRRGKITATARVGRKVSQGETWMPFHFPDSPVNTLTNAALDDFARIPEYKVCAVNISRMD